VGILPIWVCPSQSGKKGERYSFCSLDPDVLYVDFGFWGARPSDKEEGYYNRKIEEMTLELKGFKSLYSASYYTEKQFWQIYNQQLYLQLKRECDPNNLLHDLYEKATSQR
jgi:delta24-sterol reductase